jgi:hypothetical protein
MTAFFRIFASTVGLGLFATIGFDTAALASTPSPTPKLGTGDYQASWGLVAVGDPSVYSKNNIAVGLHPTTVHYDAASGTYIFTDGSAQMGFSRKEIVASSSTPAYTFYRDSASGATLRLLNQSAANPRIALTYVTYARWTPVPQSPIILNDNYVVFGSVTPSANMPRTGSASYNAILDGTYQNKSGTYDLGGSASFVANFGAGSLNMTLTAVGTRRTDGSQLQFGQLSGAGKIDIATSSFFASHPYDGATRFSTSGSFYGPQANEIGGAFTISSTLGGSNGAGAGALVGKRN